MTTGPNPQHVVLFHHFRLLLEAAAVEGIDVAPLKGAHLVTAAYPPNEDRGVMSDVDFLVRPRDWRRVLRLMRELGFEPRELFYDEERSFEAGFTKTIGAAGRVLFEPHRFLFEPARFPIDHEAIWDRAVSSSFDGAPCMRLAPEDHLCHIAFHSVVHRLANCATAARDLEALLGHGGAKGELVVERAAQWRVTRSVWLFLALLDEKDPELGLRPHACALRPPGPIAGAIRALVPRIGATRLASLNHRVQAGVLWPLLFDSPAALARLVVNHPLARRLKGEL